MSCLIILADYRYAASDALWDPFVYLQSTRVFVKRNEKFGPAIEARDNTH